jgi:hypothetical protein
MKKREVMKRWRGYMLAHFLVSVGVNNGSLSKIVIRFGEQKF